MAWELIFMLLLLKIPLVYLCAVVWYAIKAEPTTDGAPGDSAPVRAPRFPGPRWKVGHGRRLPRHPLRPERRPAGPRPRTRRRTSVGT